MDLDDLGEYYNHAHHPLDSSSPPTASAGNVRTFGVLLRLYQGGWLCILGKHFLGSCPFGRVLGILLSLRFDPTEIFTADLVGALCTIVVLINLGTAAPDKQALQVLTGLFGLSMARTDPQAKVLPSTYGYAIDGKYMSIIMVAVSLGNVFFVICGAVVRGSFCPSKAVLPINTWRAMFVSFPPVIVGKNNMVLPVETEHRHAWRWSSHARSYLGTLGLTAVAAISWFGHMQ